MEVDTTRVAAPRDVYISHPEASTDRLDHRLLPRPETEEQPDALVVVASQERSPGGEHCGWKRAADGASTDPLDVDADPRSVRHRNGHEPPRA